MNASKDTRLVIVAFTVLICISCVTSRGQKNSETFDTLIPISIENVHQIQPILTMATESVMQVESFSPTELVVATVNNDNYEISLWEFSEAGITHQTVLKGHTNRITSAKFSPNGLVFASASCWYPDKTIRLWDVKTGEQIIQINACSSYGALEFSADGKILSSAERGLGISLWEVDTGQSVYELVEQSLPNQPSVWNVTYNPKNNHVIVAHDFGVTSWDTNTGVFNDIISFVNTTYVQFSSDGAKLTFVNEEGRRSILDLASSKIIPIIGSGRDDDLPQFNRNGTLVMMGKSNNEIGFWDSNTGELVYSLKSNQGAIRGIALGFEGKLLVSGHENGTMQVWGIFADCSVQNCD